MYKILHFSPRETSANDRVRVVLLFLLSEEEEDRVVVVFVSSSQNDVRSLSLFSFEIRFVVGLFPLVVVSAVVPPAVPVVVEEGLPNAVSDFNFAFSASKNTSEAWVMFSIGFRFRGRHEPDASHPRFSFLRF